LRLERLVSFSRQRLTIDDWPGLQDADDFSRTYLHQAPGEKPGLLCQKEPA
jgi:hypothetical protein